MSMVFLNSFQGRFAYHEAVRSTVLSLYVVMIGSSMDTERSVFDRATFVDAGSVVEDVKLRRPSHPFE